MINLKTVQLKNKIDKNGCYPIYLRLTKQKKQKYINTEVRCKESEWDVNSCKINKLHSEHKTLNLILSEFLSMWTSRLMSIPVDQRNRITIEEFLKYFEKEKKQNLNFFDIINEKIENLKNTGHIGNSKCYNDTKNSIKRFTNSENLELNDIDVVWLKKYENHLKMRNCVESGISIKMRVIRAIFKDCIENKYISEDIYPFKIYKLSKFKQNKVIRAVTIEDIENISNLDTELYPKLKLSKDLFMFSYYLAGINFKDILLLQHSNIFNENRLTYLRSKTNKVFNLKINDKALEIIRYYTERKIGTEYVFPLLLKNNMTPIQIANRSKKCLTKFNKDLKEIGKICNIDIELTSYVARHSFASNLKSKGVATDVISEAMGHQDIKVTQVYLKRLENEIIDNALDIL